MYLRKFAMTMSALSILSSQVCYAQYNSNPPRNLKESISRALQLNSRVDTANERIRGQEVYAEAVKRAAVSPSLVVSGGISSVNGKTRPETGQATISKNETRFAQAQLQINLFGDGLWSTAQAAKYNAEAFAHSMNTLDSNLSFTKGSLVDGLIDSYAEVAQSRERLQVQQYRKYIYQLLVTKKLGEFEKYKNVISNIDLYIQNNTDVAIDISTKRFANFATMVPAAEIENVDQTILALNIPKTFEDAFKITLEKNPEILRRKALAEASMQTFEAIRRQNGVQVNAGITARYAEFDNKAVRGDNDSTTYTASLTASKTFHALNGGENGRAGANVNAALSEIDTVVKNEETKLYASYRRLPGARSTYQNQYKLFAEKLNLVKESVNKINALEEGASKDKFDVPAFLTDVTELLNAMTEKQKAQLAVMNELVNIYQVTGLIFEFPNQ